MATVLQHKRSSSGGSQPTVSSIALGEIAINTADGFLYIKKNIGGTESIVQFKGASTAASQVVVTVNAYTGDGVDRTFDADSTISADQVAIVTINGVLQHIDSYATNGNEVEFVTAPASGDEIEIRVINLYNTDVVLRDMKKYYYTVTGSANTVSGADDNGITLAYDVGQIDVYQNGVRLIEGSDFTATTTTSVAFTTSLESGDIVEVVSTAKASFIDSDSLKSASATFTTTASNQIVDTFSGFTYRTAKYFVSATSGSAYHAIEVMLIHDGTTVHMAEYGEVTTTAQSLFTLDADVSNGNVRLLATPALANTTIKAQRITVTV